MSEQRSAILKTKPMLLFVFLLFLGFFGSWRPLYTILANDFGLSFLNNLFVEVVILGVLIWSWVVMSSLLLKWYVIEKHNHLENFPESFDYTGYWFILAGASVILLGLLVIGLTIYLMFFAASHVVDENSYLSHNWIFASVSFIVGWIGIFYGIRVNNKDLVVER